MGLLAIAPAACALVLTVDSPRLDPSLEAVAFEDLCAAPELWLGERVETVVQFGGIIGDGWSGLLSGFDPRTHVALDAWSDAQQLWVEEEHASPVGRLFVSALGPDFSDLERYARLRLVVRVDAYFAGRGWVEVLAARPTRESVTEGTLLHAIRGLAQLDEGAPSLAASELERALRAPLPAHQRAPLAAALEDARRRAGDPRAQGAARPAAAPRLARRP